MTSLWLAGFSRGELTNADILPLWQMVNLTSLRISSHDITDLTPISGLVGLTELFIYANVTNLTPLVGLSNLRILILMENEISDISPLAGLVNLNLLYLHENQISDISPLPSLRSLRC